MRLQRVRDRTADTEQQLSGLAERLELEAEPAAEELAPDARAQLETRLERLARRREQLGPVNPLAQQEYAEALEHVEELERQRADLETALRELEKLIGDTDRQIRETFEQTFVPNQYLLSNGRLNHEKIGPAVQEVLGQLGSIGMI